MSFKRITLGGVTFYPSEIAIEDVRIADGPERMMDGTLRIWHRAFKRKWTLTWTSLPETSVAAIRTRYRTTTSQTYNDTDNTNHTVVTTAMNEKLSAQQLSLAGIFYYDVDLSIEEI
jgi:hypothetical protein